MKFYVTEYEDVHTALKWLIEEDELHFRKDMERYRSMDTVLMYHKDIVQLTRKLCSIEMEQNPLAEMNDWDEMTKYRVYMAMIGQYTFPDETL